MNLLNKVCGCINNGTPLSQRQMLAAKQATGPGSTNQSRRQEQWLPLGIS
ncbi:hypothetical protein OQG81_03520 [Streptococcus macedonicus]|uniref:Uncharacterized protein n=1 Tax=Streptococcus macedonicus TaxID=59310 RepID=A0AA47FDI2_STRMC|nr:hypothetical protein [Streptococcus macedonicus]WAK63931.1 hypothetical protein OQG81_03520 [Streptococcus macedonicus]